MNPGRWAVRYERRCRVFEDIANACRFYHSIEPIDRQTQLLSARTGIWESVAWKSPTPGIRLLNGPQDEEPS